MTETENTNEPRPAAIPPKPTMVGRGRRLLRHALARREYSALERSLDRARVENAELREMARRLREDPAAIEEQARRELGLIKPGELLFIVKDISKQ